MSKKDRYFVFHSVLAVVRTTILTGLVVVYSVSPASAPAEPNGVAKTPQMGWSSWSFIRAYPSEAIIKAQALAMHQNLQSHGFTDVNLDDYWYLNPATTVDEFGRWVTDTSEFPDGMAALGAYIHSLGLKFGMYVTPGIPVAAYNQNTKIQGTKYHAKDITDTSQYENNYNFMHGSDTMYYINYDKPGAQEFINSWANLFASWGVDYIKLDGVGSFDIPDVLAWSVALLQTGRPMHLALSNSLALAEASTWQLYSNSWRISGDVEAYFYESSFFGPKPYPLTDWSNVLNHFQLASQWTHYGGSGNWNDLDSLEIGNGGDDGTNAGTSAFTKYERQSVMSYWAMAAAPLILGTDLTANLNTYDYGLLGNSEVIAVDQAGVPGAPIDDYLNLDPNGNNPELWRSGQPDGTYAMILTNPSSAAQNGTLDWTVIGVSNPVVIRDLWGRSDLVANPGTHGGYEFTSAPTYNLEPYQSKLFKITPLVPVTRYLADAKANTLSGSGFRGPQLSSINSATDGLAAINVGNGGTITFGDVYATSSGTYNVAIVYFASTNLTGTLSVNNGTAVSVNFPTTGSSTAVGAVTEALTLNQGSNTIAISASGSSYAPDIDSIVVSSATAQYEADAAQLSGPSIHVIHSADCTDGKCVTGVSKGSTLTFTNVNAAASGQHRVIILYLAGSDTSAEVTTNFADSFHVKFPATSSNPNNDGIVGAVSLDLPLVEGVNSIQISVASGKTPNFDSIIVAE